MALVPVLSQINPAIVGQPVRFVLAVTNTGASAVNVQQVQPTVTSASGQLGMPFQLGGPYAAPNESVASTTESQFNVQITASGTAYFTFSVSLYGQTTGGAAAVGLSQFQVGCAIVDSDDAVWSAPPVNVALSMPGFGQPPGAPPNPEVEIGSLVFAAPSQSAFAL